MEYRKLHPRHDIEEILTDAANWLDNRAMCKDVWWRSEDHSLIELNTFNGSADRKREMGIITQSCAVGAIKAAALMWRNDHREGLDYTDFQDSAIVVQACTTMLENPTPDVEQTVKEMWAVYHKNSVPTMVRTSDHMVHTYGPERAHQMMVEWMRHAA